MSEPDKLLHFFDERMVICELHDQDCQCHQCQEDVVLHQAIRHLIEARPEVTRDFVQKWVERMSFDTGSILGKVKPQIYQLEEMLKEAGVKIMEEIGIRVAEENKGKVTKGFMRKWAKILDCDGLAEPDFYILIEDMLCEAGIEVEKEE